MPAPNIPDAVYTGDSFDVSGQLSVPEGLSLSPDRALMFVLDDGAIYKYSLSTPGDLTTASYTGDSFSLAAGGTGADGLWFREDGLGFYTVDYTSLDVNQWDLSAAWDITTASLAGSLDISGQAGNCLGLALKPDGTRMIFHDADTFYSYTLSTPFDITTATYDSVSWMVSEGAGSILMDMEVSADGTRIYSVNARGDVHQYDLGTAWDLSTISNPAELFDVSGQDSDPRGIHINGDAFWLGGGNSSDVFAYDLPVVLTAVRAAHTAVWSLRLAAAHTASIPLRVRATHTAVIRERVRRAHAAPVVFLAPVRAAHRALWDLREFVPVRAAHTASIPLRVRAAHRAPVPLMAFIRRAHRAVWDLRVDVRAAHKALVPLLGHDPVRAAHRAVFSLLSAPRTHLSMNVSLTAGGRTIPVLRWDLRHDEGGYLYEGEVDVDAGGYGMVRVDDPVTLDLFGEAYALVIESRRRDKRGPTGRRFVLGVRSPTVRFDFPRAEPVTKTFDESVMARAAVEELLGEALTWELVDWRIPAFRLAFEDASPIAAAQQIVEAAGGTIQTEPDGTLRARHLYPVSPKKLYADAATARVIDDQDDVTASSESFEPRRLVDRLTIRDTVEGIFSDRIEFVPDEGDDRTGTVHVYPSPWRTNLVVTHTSNASLQLTLLGETTREETEVVEFTAGTASLRFPIDALLEVDWLYDSLGGISFEPNATELQAAQEEGYSLAEIRYQTRSIDYRLASPTVDEAQLLLQEVA